MPRMLSWLSRMADLSIGFSSLLKIVSLSAHNLRIRTAEYGDWAELFFQDGTMDSVYVKI
jgi:hypothetical protein